MRSIRAAGVGRSACVDDVWCNVSTECSDEMIVNEIRTAVWDRNLRAVKSRLILLCLR